MCPLSCNNMIRLFVRNVRVEVVCEGKLWDGSGEDMSWGRQSGSVVIVCRATSIYCGTVSLLDVDLYRVIVGAVS